MQGTLPRTLAIVVILAVTEMLLSQLFFGGPHFETGKCVDGAGALADCDDKKALYRLAREVESQDECPKESFKLYAFRGSLFCGVALKGAPAPLRDVVPCLLLAGAQLAGSPRDLGFAREAQTADASSTTKGVVKVRGDDWRLFYVLFEGQIDPGVDAILANPTRVPFVAYITGASEHREEVAAATRCARGDAPAT
jgi:hypothetical protein